MCNVMLTRMHSIRMLTVRCSSHRGGGGSVCQGDVCLPREGVCHPPSVNRITDACENITLLQLWGDGRHEPVILPNYLKNCMKMKKIGPRGGVCWGVSAQGCVSGWGVSACGVSAQGVSTQGGVCLGSVCLGGVCPRGVPHTPPCEQNHRRP